MLALNKQLKEILNQYKDYLDTEEAKDHLQIMKKEKAEVKALMTKLSQYDKNSEEFTDLVLYGLLPHANTTVAKRTSLFPSFLDVKKFLNSFYHYSENEWKKIAQKIYRLCKNFQSNPKELPKLIKEFTQDKYSRRLQCGSITPILYSLNDQYPIVNNRIIRTYRSINLILGKKKKKLSQKLDEYPALSKK